MFHIVRKAWEPHARGIWIDEIRTADDVLQPGAVTELHELISNARGARVELMKSIAKQWRCRRRQSVMLSQQTAHSVQPSSALLYLSPTRYPSRSTATRPLSSATGRSTATHSVGFSLLSSSAALNQ